MTPQEKAEELYEKYDALFTAPWKKHISIKQCALIAVDEILNTLNMDIRDVDVRGNILLDLIDYWKQVKEEIEKL